jgi:1-acyl-sn-glycerol-3-phosphate acyltransferase
MNTSARSVCLDTTARKVSGTVRGLAFLAAGMVVMSGFCMVLLPVASLSGFRWRRGYAEVMGRAVSRLILRLARVRLRMVGQRPTGSAPRFYMPNHPSILDVFILTALALPNTRFFMGRKEWVYLPFAFSAWMMGVFFTPPQSRTAARIARFQRAERHLRRTGESVLGTPEGKIVPNGAVGRFNRGVFHLATNLGIPIVPIYIAYPDGKNPGVGFVPCTATVCVHFLPEIPTVDWKLAELDQNKERVRQIFLNFAQDLAADATPSHHVNTFCLNPNTIVP